MHTRLIYDERKGDEEFLLFHSDGVGLQLDVSDHQLEVLFDAGFVQKSENEMLTSREGDTSFTQDVLIHTYAVTNQKCVVEILTKFVNDSYTYFPCKNKVESSGVEENIGGEENGDRYVLPCATGGEEKVEFS